MITKMTQHFPNTSLSAEISISRAIYRLLESLARRGSSQPFWHSQWESMKMSTSPVARAAPSIRPRMTPSLLLLRMSFTPSSFEMYSLRADFRGPVRNRTVTEMF